MYCIFATVLLIQCIIYGESEPSASIQFNKNGVFSQPINMMGLRSPHNKEINPKTMDENRIGSEETFDFSKFDNYLDKYQDADKSEAIRHNRLKRRAKRRHRTNRRKNKFRSQATTAASIANGTTSNHQDNSTIKPEDGRRRRKRPGTPDHFSPVLPDSETDFMELPKDLYQAHLRPGMIFRIHMSEAIIKMQYRNYEEDKDESVIEADVEYLRLTRKVISDELTKFEDLIWLVSWFNNRSELIQEHYCNTRYYAVGTPPTMFTHPEEYMKRMCLFDNVYIDHIPYVVGEDSSLLAAVAPPVLHCDAATCTSVPFIDSTMFEERYARTNVRTVTRCQASCRAHCRNDPDCLKRCTDRCYRVERD